MTTRPRAARRTTSPDLQRLKSQGLLARAVGFEGEASLAEEGVDELGAALDRAEPAADHGLEFVEGGRAVVAQAAFHARPGALDGVEVRGLSGQVEDGELGLPRSSGWLAGST